MRSIGIVLLALSLGACKERGESPARDSVVYTGSSGEVELSDGATLRFSITSERYKQWDAARTGLDKRIASRFGAILQPATPSARNIDRAVEYLEGEPQAVASIERAGMSVRDFVVTTVALEQEMRLASARDPRPDTVMPPMPPYPPMDSSLIPDTFTPAPLPPPVIVPPYVDSARRVDTVYVVPRPQYVPTPTTRDSLVDSLLGRRRDSVAPRREFPIADSIAKAWARRDSLARRDSVARRDSARPRDSVVVKPDSVKRRDTLPTKPPRDTTRDTIPARIPRA